MAIGINNVKFLKGSLANYNALTSAQLDENTFYYTIDEDHSNKVGLYLGSALLANFDDIATAIEALDGTATIASKNNATNVVTLKTSIVEADGVISNDPDDTGIALSAVAVTGNAEDVVYNNEDSSLAASNVQDAIDALAEASAGGVASKTIYMTDDTSTSGTDYAQIYKIYQGDSGSAASPDASELIGTINIPKDQFVDEAGLADITFDSTEGKLYDGATDVTALIVGASGTATSADAGKYIKLVFAITSGGSAKSTIYIKVNSLVDVYTGGSNEEVIVDVTNNVITATIGKIAASKVDYTSNETVAAALGRLDGSDSTENSVAYKIKTAIEGLDADLDASGTAAHSGTFVISGVTEVDGVITSIDSVEVEAAGAAASASTALIGTSSDATTADTINGAKNFAEDYTDTALTWGTIPSSSSGS